MQKPARTQDRTWRWVIGVFIALLLIWAVARLVVDVEEPLAGRAVGIPAVAPDPAVPVDPMQPGEDAAYVAATSGLGEPIPVATIAVTPEPYYGRPMVGIGVVAVDQYPAAASDQGFWLEQDGRRIFAVVDRSPREGAAADDLQTSPAADAPQTSDTTGAMDLRPGQRVELSGRVYPGELASQVGEDLDPGTQLMLSRQPAFLLVDPGAVKVVQ